MKPNALVAASAAGVRAQAPVAEDAVPEKGKRKMNGKGPKTKRRKKAKRINVVKKNPEEMAEVDVETAFTPAVAAFGEPRVVCFLLFLDLVGCELLKVCF
jgi:hypothetical protein